MNNISSSKFLNEFSRYSNEAHSSPVIITSPGHDDLVLLSIKEFIRLKSLDRRIAYIHELPEDVIEKFRAPSIPEEASKFDDEVEP
jgi:PHD/YefM family antitoxin component YafN of YafNO toxin-antitoxin module